MYDPSEQELARVLPIQPSPTSLDIGRTCQGGHHTTAILRGWPPGYTSRCRLCPAGQCSAWGRDHCMVIVPDHIPEESAPLFSRVAWERERAARDGVVRPRRSHGGG